MSDGGLNPRFVVILTAIPIEYKAVCAHLTNLRQERRKGEGWTLHKLGRVCCDLGKKDEARQYFEKALGVRDEIGDRRGKGWTLHNLGMLSLEQSRYRESLASLLWPERFSKMCIVQMVIRHRKA